MNRLRIGSFILSAIVLAASSVSAQTALTRADGASVRIRIYSSATGCPRTAIFSHGYGGGIDLNLRMAEALVSSGWRVITMEHAESGPGKLREVLLSGNPRSSLIERAGDPASHRARMMDLDSAFALATRQCRPPQLVLVGHSMGAGTTMIEAGATPHFSATGRNRFDAYVAISPQGVGFLFGPGAWSRVSRPVLMITGTRDTAVGGSYTTRFAAFEGLPPGLKRLAVIEGATHMQLAGLADPTGSTLALLIGEFAAGVQAGRQTPSRVAGVAVKDK